MCAEVESGRRETRDAMFNTDARSSYQSASVGQGTATRLRTATRIRTSGGFGRIGAMAHPLRIPGLPGYITPRDLVYAYVICWFATSLITMLLVFFTAWSSPVDGYRVTVAVNDHGEMFVEQLAFAIFALAAIYVIYDQARRALARRVG
jgi:hypothetical protein